MREISALPQVQIIRVWSEVFGDADGVSEHVAEARMVRNGHTVLQNDA